jgi:hypothetical protein
MRGGIRSISVREQTNADCPASHSKQLHRNCTVPNETRVINSASRADQILIQWIVASLARTQCRISFFTGQALPPALIRDCRGLARQSQRPESTTIAQLRIVPIYSLPVSPSRTLSLVAGFPRPFGMPIGTPHAHGAFCR